MGNDRTCGSGEGGRRRQKRGKRRHARCGGLSSHGEGRGEGRLVDVAATASVVASAVVTTWHRVRKRDSRNLCSSGKEKGRVRKSERGGKSC